MGDAPFGLYWTSPGAVDFAEPFRNRLDGGTDGEGQRFPFTIPIPGSPANKTLDFSVYEPMSYFPGYDIHNRVPYAEHFNFSIQRELTKSTVLTLSYVGTEGHRLIAQTEANPGDAAFCMQLTAQGYTDQSSGAAGCGPNVEQDTFTLGANTVYGTRNALLNPNYCPGAQSLCFGFGNTFTKLVANSAYNSGQVTVQGKAGDVNFLASYTLAKAIDDSSAFGELINFSNAKLSRGLSSADVHQNFVASYVWEMPFYRIFHALPRLTKGWQLQGITRFATGFPDSDGPRESRTTRATVSVGPVRRGCLTYRQPLHRYAESRGSSAQVQSPRYSRNLHIFQPGRIYRNCVSSDASGGFDRP